MGKLIKQKERCRINVRWMIRRDMFEVLDISNLSFQAGWTEEDFLRALRQKNCIAKVAEHGDTVTGFVVYDVYKSKFHITNFAVHPNFRRKGIGASIVDNLIYNLPYNHCRRITLTAPETNLGAQFFFSEQSFLAIRVLRSFYEDSGEDAFLMEYRLPQVADNSA